MDIPFFRRFFENPPALMPSVIIITMCAFVLAILFGTYARGFFTCLSASVCGDQVAQNIATMKLGVGLLFMLNTGGCYLVYLATVGLRHLEANARREATRNTSPPRTGEPTRTKNE